MSRIFIASEDEPNIFLYSGRSIFVPFQPRPQGFLLDDFQNGGRGCTRFVSTGSRGGEGVLKLIRVGGSGGRMPTIAPTVGGFEQSSQRFSGGNSAKIAIQQLRESADVQTTLKML